jgi:hypothetical protein
VFQQPSVSYAKHRSAAWALTVVVVFWRDWLPQSEDFLVADKQVLGSNPSSPHIEDSHSVVARWNRIAIV